MFNMKTLYLLFLVLLSTNLFSQNYWYKEIIEYSNQTPIGDIVVFNSSYYFSFIDGDNDDPFEDYYAKICKVNSSGDIETSDFLNISQLNMLGSLLILNNDRIIGIGHVCNSVAELDFSLWLIEFDEELEIIEEWEFESEDLTYGYIMNSFQSKNNDIMFLMSTSTMPFSGLPGNGYIAIIDSNMVMKKDSLFDKHMYDIAPIFNSDSQFMVDSKGLDTSSNVQFTQLNILDKDFNLINTPISYPGPDMSYYFSIHNSLDSNYYFSAMNRAEGAGFVDNHAVGKATKHFNKTHFHVFDSAAYWFYTCDHNGIDSYEQFVYTGSNFEYKGMNYSYPNTFCLTQMDTSLNIINQRFYGGDKNYLLNSIKTTPEGDVLLLGRCSELDSDLWNIFIMKVNQEGLITTTNNNAEIPVKNAIILPNPGRDYLELHTGAFPATLQLHNLNGSLVLEDYINSNISRVNTLELSSGTYIWSLAKDGKLVESGKWVRE